MNFANYFAAGYPVLAVESADESQAISAVAQLTEFETFTYSASGKIVELKTGKVVTAATFPDAFAFAGEAENRILIVFDAQSIIGNAGIYRGLLNSLNRVKSRGSAIVLVSPSWKLPAELAHTVPVIQMQLPNRDQLNQSLEVVAGTVGVRLNGNRAALLDSAAGLTLSEAENAFALSAVETGGQLEPSIVAREKMRLVRNTGYLEVSPAVPVDSIGGLDQLKSYLRDEVAGNFRDPVLAVRGILLTGIPGTGKSLAAKACGSVLGLPVIRFDIAACKGSLVGQSEANIRNATRLVEAIAPCVLWVDEIEKALGGFRSSAQTDGGTTLGIVGHLLTWLQEHKSPIFTIATCNDFHALPPELTRAGRFDERFAVGLPTIAEREAIAAVHLARVGCDTTLAPDIAGRTDKFTGAEIEQLCKSAARLSARKLDGASLSAAAASIKPIAITKADDVRAFQDFATSSLRPANSVEVTNNVARVIRHNSAAPVGSN